MNKIPFDITFHPSWWHKNAGICFDEKFFDDPVYRMEADVKMRKTLFERFGKFGIGEENPSPRPLIGSDLLGMGFLHSQIMGCEVRFSAGDAPQVIKAGLTIEETEGLKAPNLDENPVWAKIQSQIDYLMKEFGAVEPCINLMGVQNIAMDLLGEDIFIAYYEEPELAENLLLEITKLSIDIGKRLYAISNTISGGVTAITNKVAPTSYVTSNCSVEMIPLDLYEKFLLKYDNMQSEVFTNYGIHHCGKTTEHVAAGYAKVNNLKFIEVGAYSNIMEVRKEMPEIWLNARYSPVKMGTSSREEMEKDIKKLYEYGAPHDKFSISCVGIDENVPDEKIIDFLEICSNL